MEPVPVTRGVRSTVRMAVALVVGQALLCALIGWLTLGHTQSGAAGSAGVDRLALPPAGPRPMPTEAPAATVRPTVTWSRQAPTTAPTGVVEGAVAPRPGPTWAVPPAPPVLGPQPLVTASATEDPGLLISPAPVATPPFGPPFDRVQEPVTVGGRCWPEGAFGRTALGILVRCLRDGRHRPRWKIA